MSTLFKTELKKIVKSRLYVVWLVLLAAIMLGISITEYNDMRAYRNNHAYQNEVMSWREREENVITYGGQSLQEDPFWDALQKEQISRRIAIAEYRLQQDVEKDIYKNVWWFFNDNMFNVVSGCIVVMVVFLCSAAVAGEYSGHTLRQVLLLPYRRWKILLCKFLAVLASGLALYGLMFALGLLSGIVIHGGDGFGGVVVLYFSKGPTPLHMGIYSLLVVLLKTVEIGFYAAFALLVSVLAKNTAAAAVISGAAAVLAPGVLNFLGSYYPAVFYLPFYNLDFRRYLDFGTVMPQIEAGFGSVVIQGISPALSAVIVGVTLVLCLLASFAVFKRQDV